MAMVINAAKLAMELIKGFEGLRLSPYYCSGGQRTIGYGHVMQWYEQLWHQISPKMAEELLDNDIAIAGACLRKNCGVPLTGRQEAALISFIFNCGSGAFQASTLRQKLNRGEYELAANELPRWIYSGGIKLAGLVKRRQIERSIFLMGT